MRHYYLAINNRPFPSCLKPLFQSEAKCEAIDKKMILYSYAKNPEPRFECDNQFGTRKWPTTFRLPFSNYFLLRRNKKREKFA